MTSARLVTALLSVSIAGCSYYNGMWSAQRLARDARRMEARGQMAEARSSWSRAAVKAESMLVHHPHSRWVDEALVLQAEGLARSGSCAAAARPLTRALQVANDALRERAALAAAECAMRAGEAGAAERLLVPLLESADRPRRSGAAYLAGRVALDRGDAMTAAERFARSERPEAAPAQIRALVAAGRSDRAVRLMDSLARRDRDESRWTDALDDLGREAGAATAADGLDKLIARGRLGVGAQARLLIADGDRLRTARLTGRAAARYAQVTALVPDSVEGGRARVRTVLLLAAGASGPANLDSVSARLSRVTLGLGGTALAEASELQHQILAMRSDDSSEVVVFHAAELARDTLAAPALAAALFLRFADRFPSSLFAPKALIAAGQLRPDVLDSVGAVLRTRYADSPYTLVFRGEASPAFQVVEDSLAVALGVRRLVASIRRGGAIAFRVALPRPGPRGPEFDPPLENAAGVAARPPAGHRPVRARPTDERPVERPEDRP